MADNDELLIDVLRAAGHEDAADLASKLMARGEPAATEVAEEAGTPTAGVSPMGPQTAADLDAEARAISDAMKRGLTSHWTSAGAA